MLYNIVSLIVDTIGALVVGACLLRIWMQMRRVGMRNPVGIFVMAMTDWIVRPLRRIVPGAGGIDWASIVAAFLISLVAVLAVTLTLSALQGFLRLPSPDLVIELALVWLVRWGLYLAQLIVLLVAVLSWINPFSPVLPILDALTAPLLRPIRQILPTIGRFDLSPMVLFLLIAIAQIVLHGLSLRWLGIY